MIKNQKLINSFTFHNKLKLLWTLFKNKPFFFHFLFKEIQQKPALTVKGNENGGLLNTVVDKCSSHKNLTLSHNYVILNLLCAEHVKQ